MSENTATETTTVTTALNIPDYLQHLLDQIAVREGFAAGYTIETESGSKNGDGFQGLLIRTTICGRRNNDDDQRLALICKVPPSAEIRRKMCALSFRQEVFAYDTLLPKLIELQTSKNIAVSDGFYAFPKCYGTFSDETTNLYAIVLEDLCSRGCRMFNKVETVDFEHVKLVLAEMGKYHALSFALRDQQPDVLNAYAGRKSGVKQAMIEFPPAKQFFTSKLERAIDLLTAEEYAALKLKMTKLRDNYGDVMDRVTSGTISEPFSVVSHGDCWNNNVMFEYDDEKSRTAKSVCLIDWQNGSYCSPAYDLAFYLFSSTERALRDEHYDDMLKVYYSSLTKLLTLLGSDAEKLFPYDAFLEQMKNFSIYAMLLLPISLEIMTVDATDFPDFENIDFDQVGEVELISKANSPNFDVRMRDVLFDFDARGYFDSIHFDY